MKVILTSVVGKEKELVIEKVSKDDDVRDFVETLAEVSIGKETILVDIDELASASRALVPPPGVEFLG